MKYVLITLVSLLVPFIVMSVLTGILMAEDDDIFKKEDKK